MTTRLIKNYCISFLLLLITTSEVFAADFSTDLVTTYTVTTRDVVHVNQIFSITNLTDTRFPTSYEFDIPSKQLKNIKITDAKGQLVRGEIVNHGSQTKVVIEFPKPIVGQGKTQTYSIEYQNPEILISNNSVLQLGLPNSNRPTENATTTVKVVIPSNMCPNPYSSFGAFMHQNDNGLEVIMFKDQDANQPIFIRCANERYLSLHLKYYLTNPNMTPIETQIALPPDTAYQQFGFDNITPTPIHMSTDHDGNVIATYKLEPSEVKQIQVEARAILTATSNPSFSLSGLDKAYLEQKPKWPVHSAEVKKNITLLKNPLQIYQFVTMNTDKNVDSYITLSRASGVMTRRLVGVSLGNENRFWADYYDQSKNTWVQIDPDLEKETSVNYFPINDLNHIVLAINGSDDTFPYAVGSYKSPDSIEPDIIIKEISSFSFDLPEIEAKITRTFVDYLNITQKNNLTLHNRSLTGIYNQSFDVLVDGQIISTLEVNRLSPASQVIIPITLPKTYEKLIIAYNNKQIEIKTEDSNFTTPVAIAAFLAVISGFIAVFTRRLLVSRRT